MEPFCSLYRIIHNIKCNMLSKSSKWELCFIYYIVKFTISRFVISRFVISRFECTSHVWQVVSRNTTQALEARPFCLLARYIFVHIVYNKNNCLMNKELHSLFLLFFPLSLHLHQNKVCLQCQALLVGMQMQSNLNCVFLILQRQDTYFILCSGAPDIYKTQ